MVGTEDSTVSLFGRMLSLKPEPFGEMGDDLCVAESELVLFKDVCVSFAAVPLLFV